MRVFLIALAAGVATFVVVFVVVFVLFINLLGNTERIDSFRTHCAEAGGHIYAPEVIFCVTEDGRLIEVYP